MPDSLFENPFVRVIVIPIILTIAAAILESVALLVTGVGNGERKYMIWTRDCDSDGNWATRRVPDQSIADIRVQPNIIEVYRMVTFDVAEYDMLGINLIIGAFAVDIAALINTSASRALLGVFLCLHLFLLVISIAISMLSQLTPPEDRAAKRQKVATTIGFGLLAMVLAFAIA